MIKANPISKFNNNNEIAFSKKERIAVLKTLFIKKIFYAITEQTENPISKIMSSYKETFALLLF